MARDVAALAAEMTPYLSAAVGAYGGTGSIKTPENGQHAAKCESNYAVALAIAKSVHDDAEQAANLTYDDGDLHCPAGSPGRIDATGPARLRGRDGPSW